MITCEKCKHSCMTTKHELLGSCPECDPNHWRVHRVNSTGRMPMRLARAIEKAKARIRGRIFMTPKGFVVDLNQWRVHKKAEKTRKLRFR